MLKDQSHCETIPAAQLLPSYDKINDIAIQTQLVRRISDKFCPQAFLMIVLQATIQGKGTLEHLASELGNATSRPMSRSGMHQRFTTSTVKFFIQTLFHVMAKDWNIPDKIKNDLLFQRILIEDSSQLNMNARNSNNFPAHGNGKSKTAGCKIDFTYDLLAKKPVNMSLHLATDQDKDLGKEVLRAIEERDLYLRDMGYFIISEFTLIEDSNAYWLSRLPANVHCFCEKNKKVKKLEEILKKTRLKQLDITAFIGKSERKKVRLIAVRVDDKTLEKRRRERKDKELKVNKKSSEEMKIRDEWHIMVTNITPQMYKVEELCSLYRLRWHIELSFKAWKQSGAMTTALSRKSNEYYLQSLILASMIRFALSFQLHHHLRDIERLSMDKMFKRRFQNSSE